MINWCTGYALVQKYDSDDKWCTVIAGVQWYIWSRQCDGQMMHGAITSDLGNLCHAYDNAETLRNWACAHFSFKKFQSYTLS